MQQDFNPPDNRPKIRKAHNLINQAIWIIEELCTEPDGSGFGIDPNLDNCLDNLTNARENLE